MSKRNIFEDRSYRDYRNYRNYRNYSNYRKTCSLSGLSGLLLAAGLFFAGCQSDPDEVPVDNRPRTTMELLTYSNSFLEVTPWVTRADPDFHFPTGYQTNHLPDGYISYETLRPHATMAESTIGVFMTPGETDPAGNFIYQGIDEGVSVWKSTIVVEEDKQYYIYGFMPRSGAENATITSLNGDYQNGAVITLENYDAVTTADVSVIVGLRWATEDEKINGIASTGSDVPLGHFGYKGMPEGENRLFVLLKHIYAGLHFATKVDPVYNTLRTIRITKVELTAKDIKEKVNLEITLTANANGEDPLTNVTYTPVSSSSTNTTITLYEKDDVQEPLGVTVPADQFNDFLGCLVPGSSENFVLRTTYDVYDKDTSVKPEGNLIRKGCVAENIIDRNRISTFPNLKAGELFTINLLIQPTFLYVLSEPDLDNPTIVVN
ncbi:MAG: hypothetical protein IJ754_06990 [Bacteroidaceae bacterium]|nr:hypothetical protein [Bacteroidaceae bacterium]